jgi:hypothetical protein
MVNKNTDSLRALLRLADARAGDVDASDALIAGAFAELGRRRRRRRTASVVVGLLIILTATTPWLIHRDHQPRSVVLVPTNPAISMQDIKLAVAQQQAVVQQLLAAEQRRYLEDRLAALEARPGFGRRIDNERESAALAIVRQASCADAADAAVAYQQVATLFPQTSAAVVARARLQSNN